MRQQGWSFGQWFVYGGIGAVVALWAVVCIAAMYTDGWI